MVRATNGSVTPSAFALYFGKLTTKTPTASDSIKHVAFGRALVVTWSVVSEFDKPFENADRLILSTIDQESLFKPVNIILWNVALKSEEHLYQRTFLSVASDKNVEEVQEHQLSVNKLLNLFLGRLEIL